ncbi:MAG: RluA family pseudouridine synthase [Magnetococcales bacterium]|nr:RluA family pseudouridine synthase [Magnetococcales bacterium]
MSELPVNRLQKRLPEEMAGERLDKALAILDQTLSRVAIQRLIHDGRVWVNDAPPRGPSQRMHGGEMLAWERPEPEPSSLVAEAIPLDIRFEDGHLLVIDKPAGMVVHPGAGVNQGTLVHAVLGHCGDTLSGIGGVLRPGIVHRLDKDTSGLLVVAKSDGVHQGLAAQFEAHSVTRRYLAILRGIPRDPSGVIDAPIGRHPGQRTRMAVRSQGGRNAVTRFRVQEILAGTCALIHCHLQTGRTHQIRVHLAHIGHPVLGDPVYGRGFDPPRHWPDAIRRTIIDFRRQALHAETLGFRHPVTGEPLLFVADPPEDFRHLLDSLRCISQDFMVPSGPERR